MAKVSIVIPVYNCVKYIRECMDSILYQSLFDIEIIPVDAGSTDGTAEILREYAKADDRIKVLNSNKKSVGFQYNIGIEAAAGTYIGFCEADDYISDSMYEKLYAIAERGELDYVKSDFDMFIDKGERIFLNYQILTGNRRSLYGHIVKPRQYPDLLYRDINMWNGIYKKSFLEHNGIRQNLTPKVAFQDMGFIIQTFLAAERAMYVQEETNKYRRDNIRSSIYDLKSIINIVQEAEFAEQYLTHIGKPDSRLQAAIFSRFYYCFCHSYGKLPCRNQLTEDINDAIERFVLLAKKWYSRLEYNAISMEGLDKDVGLTLFLSEFEGFDFLQRKIDINMRKCLHEFYRHVTKYPRTVIFGAGEIGTSTFAMLRRNDYTGDIFFCDNDRKKWGCSIMGVDIISPDEAKLLNDGQTSFVIGTAFEVEMIRGQLLGLGVKSRHIYKAVTTVPHHAFEVNIK